MREKDSQVVSIFTLSGSTSVKAERKCSSVVMKYYCIVLFRVFGDPVSN
jgi:hypothetical protein